VIGSFRDADTRALFSGKPSRRFLHFARVAQRKLQQLHAAHQLHDVTVFLGNHLEALHGSRQGHHSIRINDQYRLCFVWRDGDAHDVEILDY
jgi:proteic killer suppression protein